MTSLLRRLAAPVRNQMGVAFPVALMGILGVSVTITAVLLTATTESALSTAHQDATRDLYIAQGGLEAYVAETGMALAPVTDLAFLPAGAPEGDETRITVRQLSSTLPPHPAAQPDWPRDLLFSVEARPIRGGRTISALASVISTLLRLTNNVDAAMVSEKNVVINGAKTTISDGADSPYCSPDSAARHAIQIQEGTKVDTGTAMIKGKVDTVEGDSYGWVYDMLGTSFETLVENANIKIIAATVSGPKNVSSFGSKANTTDPQLTPWNWGCPVDLLRDATPKNCLTDGATDAAVDTMHFPIVVIDALKSDGVTWGDVVLNVDHGQGLLIIKNGNLDIQGRLAFKGLILVEGNFTVRASGGGAMTPKIEGSIIGLGKGDGISKVDETMDITGAPTIRYNRCAINSVLQAINQSNSFDRVMRPTSGWFEVVR
jgi:hypothetical protein